MLVPIHGQNMQSENKTWAKTGLRHDGAPTLRSDGGQVPAVAANNNKRAKLASPK
jgi:hypothetical protein